MMGDWLEALKAECARTSQNKTAQKLGVSGATVNQILAGKYQGNVQNIAEIVRNHLVRSEVECPLLGTISGTDCANNAGMKFKGTNSFRARLFRTCKNCVHNNYGGNHE